MQQLVPTSSCSATAISHPLQFTTDGTKSSQSTVSSPVVAWWRIPKMTSAPALRFLPVGDSPTANSLLSGWRSSHTNLLPFSLPSEYCLLMAAGLLYVASARIAQKTPLPTSLLLLHACVLRQFANKACYLQSHYLATAIVWLLISRSLSSNGSTIYSCNITKKFKMDSRSASNRCKIPCNLQWLPYNWKRCWWPNIDRDILSY
jgi:hypothetical protein